MTDKPAEPEGTWPRGWEGHEEAQRKYTARLPFWEKLAWLEEADEVARHLARRHAARMAGRSRSGSGAVQPDADETRNPSNAGGDLTEPAQEE